MVSSLELLVHQVSDLAGKKVCNLCLLTKLNPVTLQVQISPLTGKDTSINDCVIFSKQLEEALDNSLLFSEAYTLEVSSLGLSEEIVNDRDFRSFRGFPVEVNFRKSKSSTNRYEGLLLERNDQSVLLNIRGRICRIPREDVIRVQLISRFDQT